MSGILFAAKHLYFVGSYLQVTWWALSQWKGRKKYIEIIKVEVGVISWSRKLRLITLTETLIILDITKTEPNNCFIMHSMKKKMVLVFNYFCDVLLSQRSKPRSHIFAPSQTANNTKRANLTWLPLEIMHCGHTWHDYSWPWVTLTWLLYNLQVLTSRALISKIHCRLWANQKRVREVNV